MVDEICDDFASIVLLEKNQPILECKVSGTIAKIAFFTINPFDVTTCAVMYIFTKSNDCFAIERHMISAKECLCLQNSLTKDSVLTDEFPKHKNVTKKYNILAKNLSLKLIVRVEDNEIHKYDLLKDFLFIGGTIYTHNESLTAITEKSAPVGVEFSICAMESCHGKSDKGFEKYRLVKFFSENF